MNKLTLIDRIFVVDSHCLRQKFVVKRKVAR